MTQWTLTIRDETDRSVRRYLAREGRPEQDLSEFVDRAVRQAIFWEVADSIQEHNRDLSPEEAQALADDAVTQARANPA